MLGQIEPALEEIRLEKVERRQQVYVACGPKLKALANRMW